MASLLRRVIVIPILFLTLYVSGQTAGSGIVSQIESLAAKEEKNSEKVGELNRKHMDTYVLEDLKLKRLEEEVRDLERKQLETEMAVEEELERKLDEIENGESWKNRRESARRGYKEHNPGTCGAGGPPPICKVNHWYRVSVDEAMREYDALVEKELDKIRKKKTNADSALADKRQELDDFRYQENEFAKKRDDINEEMNELIADNNDIRERIQELSKEYVRKVNEEAESKQNNDIANWLSAIAQKHYAELKVGILEAKIDELAEEEAAAIIKLEDQLRKENQQEIEEKERRRELIRDQLVAFIKRKDGEIDDNKTILRAKRAELNEVEYLLDNPQDLTQADIDLLVIKQTDLENEIDRLEQIEKGIEREQKNEKQVREAEIKQLDDEIWDLTVDLPSKINEEVNDLKEAFAAKREILVDAIDGRKLKINSLEAQISDHEDAFRAKVYDYESRVEPERLRIMDACSSAGASCWGSGIVGDIWSSANNLISCAHQLEMGTQYYSGCEKASKKYKTEYNSRVNGISDRDLGVLRRQNSSYKYQDLLKKFD
ncbi:hypothetical protein [Sanyastnella coralliicola]|uniref:hypothetical protein n=1 Tax=Sanyastnella coralliicola TaxID=3069118 RepID=UPI0027BAF4DC|nr:hypothetical protein [Longitalea sp. SCSIO 12813]